MPVLNIPNQLSQRFAVLDIQPALAFVNIFFDDLKSQFTIVYALIALLAMLFYRDLAREDRRWLLFLLIAFVCIVFFYALAELSVVLVEIALNTRGLHPAPAAPAPIPVPAPQPAPLASSTRAEHPHAPILAPLKCSQCDHTVDAGTTFCDECGKKVG